jgi:hypothetical protein
MGRPQHAGYLVIDHRNSPGVPGLPKYFEADTQHCNHCNGQVILNPERKRERFICPKCDWYCCDNCAVAFKVNGICKPFEQVADEVQSGKIPFPVLAKDMRG